MTTHFSAVIYKSVLAAGLLLFGSTTALAGTFVIDCGLNDGSKFVLRAEYSRNFLPGHHGPYTPKGFWEVYYKAKNHVGKTQAPASIQFSSSDCTQVGMVNGTPVVYFSFLDRHGNWFKSDLLPKAVFSSGSPDTQPPAIRKKLAAKDLFIPYMEGFVAPFDHTIVYEAPVLDTKAGDGNGIVVAVLQTISSDNGRTWLEPDVTTLSRIYELGKSPKSQSFYGKVTKSTVPR